MDFNELAASISEAENIPAGKVRKILKAFLEKMGDAIDNVETFQLPGLIFNSRTLPARDAQDGKPARVETKVATLRRKPAKN